VPVPVVAARAGLRLGRSVLPIRIFERLAMKLPWTATRIMIGVVCLAAVPAVLLAAGQDPGGGGKGGHGTVDAGRDQAFSSVADLEASYAQQVAVLERKRLLDLTALAQRLTGIESERAYRAAFDLAVARGLYAEAEPAASAYVAKESGEAENHALAASIMLITRASRGEFDESLADLKRFLARRAAADIPDERRLPAPLVCAVGEAYLHRLVRHGRFDIAREVCRLAASVDHPDKVVQNHFAERLARFEMVGKLAPAIEGTDVDGKPVRLSDLKGKVVLIDFWASWAPPCVVSFPHLRDLLLAHRDQGFAILGVNLDAMSQDHTGKQADPKEVLATVRWFLLQHRASWPNLIADGAQSAAKNYGVSAVPSSFLVARDGTIVGVELSGSALAHAVEQTLKGQAASGQR
jgi:peroxiredoxin